MKVELHNPKNDGGKSSVVMVLKGENPEDTRVINELTELGLVESRFGTSEAWLRPFCYESNFRRP